jgi:hypothetical protein
MGQLEPNMEKHYLIPQSILDDIMQYLATRPYREVANGIAALRALKEVEKSKKEDADGK